MRPYHNPYAKSLDGLKIEDPVSSFFNFCKERERIRLNRKNKKVGPWSNDPIFQNGRFLNVFREDDRGSKAILNFCNGMGKNIPNLIQALFFARWCNRQETLDQFSVATLLDPDKFKTALDKMDSWCNLTAYPVESIIWKEKTYNRLETSTLLFNEMKGFLTSTILTANGDVTKATNDINSTLNMKNNFPIFMAVMDLAWFRPDLIKPESHVPTGIGAVAYLDLLQKHLKLKNHNQTCDKMISLQKEYWPEAKRSFHPIDIEYLSCECRKYYSYVNKTKKFEGKNHFTPNN